MTSSLKPTMSKRLRSWSEDRPELFYPAVLFVILLIHGATLGLTDDEAYYWVLAQRPALGYAFHPPAVAWVIALSEGIFGWLLGPATPVVARLPAAAFSALVFALGLRWMSLTGAPRERMWRGALALLSFAGLFSASWMMVPDLPLLGGWMLLFVATWRLCFEKGADERPALYAWLVFATALALLSKFSAVLAAGSAGLALLIWGSRRARLWGCAAIVSGALIAGVPIVLWNMSHEWGSLLYQFRDRHGGAQFSGMRYLRFWLVQAILAGPFLLAFGARIVRQAWTRRDAAPDVSRYLFIWIAPGFVAFCIQPAWSDFKAHWAFVVWLPMALGLGLAWAKSEVDRWGRLQAGYGISLLAFVILFCHVPLATRLGAWWRGHEPDPRWDVTNDMYGWSELEPFLRAQGLNTGLPILASRYQTASQAAFAVGDAGRVELVPRDLKQRDEWPQLEATEGHGPEWPRLKRSVLFIADNRYSGGPEFPHSSCRVEAQLSKTRLGMLAKRIDVWRCEPVDWQPESK